MGVPRAAGLLVGLGLIAAAPASSREPIVSRDDSAIASGLPQATAADAAPAQPRPAEASVPTSSPDSRTDAAADARQQAQGEHEAQGEQEARGAREAHGPQQAEPASTASVSAPILDAPSPATPSSAALDIAPPDLPAAAVVLPGTGNSLSDAIAARLSDQRVQLHPRLSKKEREALSAFYASSAFKPIWIKDGAWTAAAEGVIARLKNAGDDALEEGDYPVPAIRVVARGDSAADLAEAELKLAVSAVLYARDARGGRIDLSRLSSLITPKLELPAADAVLARLAGAPDTDAALGSYNPSHAGYRALRAKLSELRAARPSGTPMVRVPQGPALKVGMRDPRVPLIRARFGVGPAGGDETAYDERTASAVADFQREKGLTPNGVLTRQTIAALSGPSPARVEGDLIANMERWRWLPSDLGTRHIAVNIPEFRLRIMDGTKVVHQTRVVVGKPETQTPVFSGVMEYAIVNPSWNVPPSILKKEFLPQMALDPFYAEKKGYQVIRHGNTISVRQPPGERNALGFIKFMFPNQHAVYLHDTPSRSLFSADRRAFSHGCVRVDQPFQLADQVLGRAWSESRLKSLIGRGERTINLPERLPVHLTYFTIVVDDRGDLRTLDDLYGHNRRVRAALGLDG